jgi:hypothetical protein
MPTAAARAGVDRQPGKCVSILHRDGFSERRPTSPNRPAPHRRARTIGWHLLTSGFRGFLGGLGFGREEREDREAEMAAKVLAAEAFGGDLDLLGGQAAGQA